jgi:uncharacterized protein YbaA (DUF1428 family)
VIPVPTARKEEFLEHARKIDAIFLEWGALRIVECWGDDVPAGKTTDFARSVQATPEEAIVFSWIEWPDKATRDAAGEKMMSDPRMMSEEPPFDGKRLIYGGFAKILELAA